MADEPKHNPKSAFQGARDSQHADADDVPARIKKDAPKPVLRPDGTWKAGADRVDRDVREKNEAETAKTRWNQRSADQKRGRGLRRSFHS